MNEITQIPHEKLEVYRLMLQFIPLTKTMVLTQLSITEIAIAGELQRKINYAFNRIVEGADRPSTRQKNYREALEMLMECAGLWDGCRALNVIDENLHAAGRQLLERIIPEMGKLTH